MCTNSGIVLFKIKVPVLTLFPDLSGNDQKIAQSICHMINAMFIIVNEWG